MNDKRIETKWTKEISKLLLDRKIVGVRYMTEAEKEDHGWYKKSIVLRLDSGLLVYPSMDDEGNDGGALFTTDNNTPVIPVIT